MASRHQRYLHRSCDVACASDWPYVTYRIELQITVPDGKQISDALRYVEKALRTSNEIEQFEMAGKGKVKGA